MAGSGRKTMSAGEKEARKRAKEEAKIDRWVRDNLGQGPEDYTPENWRSFREQIRAQVLYPGKFVASRDHHEGVGEERRLVRREILCVSTSLNVIGRCIKRLPEEEQRWVMILPVPLPEEEGHITQW